MHIRSAIGQLPTSPIGQIAALGMGDPDVLGLWYGESDVPTPDFIGEAAAAALAAGHTFYTWKAGLPALREAIANYLGGLYRRPVAAERIVVTSSAMNALMLVAQLLVDSGDNLVIAAPVWPNIAAAVRILAGEPRLVPLEPLPGGGWRLDPQRLFAACDARTRAIFINSPSNPTGWVAAEEDLAAVLDFARRRGVWLILDEVYARIVYGNRAAPSLLDIAEPDEQVIVVNSFSKAWAMTGWRLGWLVLPDRMVPEVEKLVEYNTSGSPTFLQHAAIAALAGGEAFIDGFVARCRAARDVVIDGLQSFARVSVARPQGAFYAFFRVEGVDDSLGFAKRVLAETKVGLAPGIAFGPMGEGYLRLCFARSPETMAIAVERLRPLLS